MKGGINKKAEKSERERDGGIIINESFYVNHELKTLEGTDTYQRMY